MNRMNRSRTSRVEGRVSMRLAKPSHPSKKPSQPSQPSKVPSKLAWLVLACGLAVVTHGPARAQECAPPPRDCMAAAASLKVPLKVDVGSGANWDEAH